MTLIYSNVALPMKGRLLNCLPSIRWIPHDIPAQSDSSSHATSHSHSLFSSARKGKKGKNPQPPLHRRKSALSITSAQDPELDARTDLQAQSRFFSALPYEIRVMVYELVMGCETVHLTLGSKGRFGHFVCPEGEAREGCGCRVLVGGGREMRLGGWMVGVLRVCRRMYTEAVPHLYKPHTFSLLHPTHLLYLPARIPVARLNNIRRLHLRWTIRALPLLRRGPHKKLAYPEDTTNWQRGWNILAHMKGLRDLRVVLIDPSRNAMWETHWLELEGDLLECVKAVRQTRWFELALPYESCSTDWDLGGGVVLRKPEGDVEEDQMG
ncbi:hypothetical protein CC78DRAFT_534406 [Lojkania enalia]|uniref:DUF7730 domain-containing protein n=1 Tax=Lojkania enalia TaxID=147567 RepID=A0A9P4K7B3_9PLEO|nr:hypothetical protein CC78DRAFT_534406 [Didymosphaeria enalia]